MIQLTGTKHCEMSTPSITSQVRLSRGGHRLLHVNHNGTEAILAEAIKRRDQIERFVYISSLAAVGPDPHGQPVDEDTCPRRSLLTDAASSLPRKQCVQSRSVPVTIVRPPAVYGPRDYGIFEFFKAVKGGMFPMIGRRDKRVSLVHARDLADGIILAGESEASIGRTYFISSEDDYSMRAVADLIAALMRKRLRTSRSPLCRLWRGGRGGSRGALMGKPPVINRDKVTDLSQTSWTCSIERAKSELGYTPQVPFEEGLRETIAWYKSEGWL